MDTSLEYVKMCTKAKEIQGLTRSLGICEPNYQVRRVYMSETGDWWHLNIWLPTQDQLQEMLVLVNDGHDWERWLFSFVVWRFNCISADKNGHSGGLNSYTEQFTSMEQLWLAFVMNERYVKLWSVEKEEWVNGNGE